MSLNCHLWYSVYVATETSIGSNEPLDPCSPQGYKDNSINENVTPSSLIEKNKQPILHASGNFSECRSASLTLLQKGKGEF